MKAGIIVTQCVLKPEEDYRHDEKAGKTVELENNSSLKFSHPFMLCC